MTKITTEHLARNACVYIRQSTADQLAHNHESRRRQYGLVDRAKQLGWSNVEVIDDDLGRSGGGIARPGFERLVCTENLNPNVLMMKSAQDSVRTYHAGSLYRPRNRRIFVQRSMRSDAVVIIGVRFQNAA